MGIDPINIKPPSSQTPAAGNSSKSPDDLTKEIDNIKARRPDVEIVDDKTGNLISKPSNGQPPVAKWGVDDSSSSTAASNSSLPSSQPAHKSSSKPPVKKGNWIDKNIVGPIKKTVSKVKSWFKKVF